MSKHSFGRLGLIADLSISSMLSKSTALDSNALANTCYSPISAQSDEITGTDIGPMRAKAWPQP
jgi:hypothetical protein